MGNIKLGATQKFLVLVDFSKSSYKALKYAISLAKTIEAKLVLLYVGKPRDLVKGDNPSVVLRAIDIAAAKAEAQLKSIIEMIEAGGVEAGYINTVGNVTTQVNLYANKYNPNLIVIGKSRYGEHPLGEITNFLLYQNTGNLLIVGNELEFNENTKVSVECNAETLNDYSSNILFWLNKKSKEPLRVFINKKKRATEEFIFPDSWDRITESSHKICIKNRKSFSLANSIVNHISDEKIDLICIGRKGYNKSIIARLFNQTNTISDVINHARIPTLILGGRANS
jgi:nucleotide-binding universal stress UspA family protein